MTNIAVKTRKEVSEGTASSATPLSKRVYSESSDQEMDIWIQVDQIAPKDERSIRIVQLAVL